LINLNQGRQLSWKEGPTISGSKETRGAGDQNKKQMPVDLFSKVISTTGECAGLRDQGLGCAQFEGKKGS